MARRTLFERRMSRFLRGPGSVRNAVSVIVVSTLAVVLGSGLLMRLLDASEYRTPGRGFWWAIQTVTTVGYGDVTPRHDSGRIVATVVMLYGIAFLAILTAVITSTFVARAAEAHASQDATAEEEADTRLETRLDDLAARLDRIEQLLSR